MPSGPHMHARTPPPHTLSHPSPRIMHACRSVPFSPLVPRPLDYASEPLFFDQAFREGLLQV